MTFTPSTFDHILFALLAFVLPLFAVWVVKPQTAHIPQTTREKVRIYWANSAVLWVGAIIVIALWLIMGRGFDILGFTLPGKTNFPEWFLLVMFFILLYMFDAFASWNEGEDSPAEALLPKNRKELFHFSTVVSASAAICEEIVFRGFLITYVLSICGEGPKCALIAILGTSIIFGIVHAYQGWSALLKIAFLSVLFATIFYLSESLLIVIVLHFLVDFFGGWISYFKFKTVPDRREVLH